MIIGIGIDHCSIGRMTRVLERYEHRLSTRFFAGELRYCTANPIRKNARFAMHFAAREAASKALGTGFRQGVSLSTIEVIHLASGQPTLKLHGAAARRLHALTPAGTTPHLALSLTDENDTASAICIISAH